MTGIGFVSSNKALIIGKAFNWYFKESARFPAKKEFVISRVREGFIFERTDITPWPHNDKIGKIYIYLNDDIIYSNDIYIEKENKSIFTKIKNIFTTIVDKIF